MISDKYSSVNTISPSHVLLQNVNQMIYQQYSSHLYLTSADLVSGTLYISVYNFKLFLKQILIRYGSSNIQALQKHIIL